MRNILKSKKISLTGGFSLLELVAVVAIIGIVAVMATPSMVAYMENGKQQNRTNIARTLYLATQNQLTKLSSEKSLKSSLSGFYFEKDSQGNYTENLIDEEKNTRNVAQLLVEDFPVEDIDNVDYVHYISKPKGYIPPEDIEIDGLGSENERNEARELKSFYNLLDQIIIDKSILNEAILIEYNVSTGVILSLFYGDSGQEKFDYDDSKGKENIIGGRGRENGYQYAYERRQGYYGVEATGSLSILVNYKEVVNIYDGISNPLNIGSGESKKNILYAELLLPKQIEEDGVTEAEMPEYTFELVGEKSSSSIVSVTVDNLDDVMFPNNFNSALNNFTTDNAIYWDNINPVEVYEYGINIGENYNRYIWIIDYIEGDISTQQPYSIDEKYGSAVDTPQNIRVKATKAGGTGMVSFSIANTHFNNELSGGVFEIKSARHLNNIRYNHIGQYRQTANIDMMEAGNEITNFPPIMGTSNQPFSGEYYAMKTANTQYRIENLNIDSNKTNVGLFGRVNGATTNIQGVSLYKAVITAKNSDNVGAIVGLMEGGSTLKQCNSYANVSVNSNKSANVGGLVGRISNGTLSNSFNAGFYNAPDKSASIDGFGWITANRGNIGGLVGLNYSVSSIIENSYNNARVNVSNVSITRDGKKLSYDPIFTKLSGTSYTGGIVGYNNSGKVKNTYATNFLSLVADNNSVFGGIIGNNVGSSTLENNLYIENGAVSVDGEQEIVSTKDLTNNPMGGAFTKNSVANVDNSYKNYPYPTLKNNNPFSDSNYNWTKYSCGWENIYSADEKVTDVGLIYYELYDDKTTGFSGGSFAHNDIVPAGSTKKVINDGYAIDVAFTTADIEVEIDTQKYTLNLSNSTTPSATWKDSNNVTVNATNAIVKYKGDGGDDHFLMFFDNDFLESHGKGATYINFKVTSLTNSIIEAEFNPLFANTVDRMVTSFSIRSPRQFQNISNATTTDFSQGLDIDFDKYSKTASFTTVSTGTLTGNKISFGDNAAVVNNQFNSEYIGNDFTIKISTVDKGLFANINTTGSVKRINLVDSTIGKNNILGGIANINNGTIDMCNVLNTVIDGTSDIGIVVGINNGKITNTAVTESTLLGVNGDNHGAIAGINKGTIENCIVKDSTIGGSNIVGGIAGENSGTINLCNVGLSTISASYDRVGGIAGKNLQKISNVTVTEVTVENTNSGRYVGGIAGENTSEIEESTVNSSKITSIYGVVGGVTGSSTGRIQSVTVTKSNIKNATSGGNVGGISGENMGTITMVHVVESDVSAINDNVGGLSGNNTGSISNGGVSFSTTNSTVGNNIGGVVGNNNKGTVADVFFLSINDINNIPVFSQRNINIGGIIGNNQGDVQRAFYYAPSPNKTSGNTITIYPIVGTGNASIKDDNNETSFYLSGYRYTLDKGNNWTIEDYNRISSKNADGKEVVLSGGGSGLVSKFMDKEWLDFSYAANLTKWYQPTNGYLYPMPIGIEAPDKYPQTDSPARPEQVDRPEDEWKTTESTSDRGRNVTFINGDFSTSLDIANYLAVNTSDPNNTLVDNASKGYRRVYMNMRGVDGWSTRPVNTANIGNSNLNSNKNYWIELQVAVGKSSLFVSNVDWFNDYMAANYKGKYDNKTPLNVLTSAYKYAELNAHVQGTLYQVATTTPKAEFYYSYNHSSRINQSKADVIIDKMNFYLTGVSEDASYAQDSDLVLIRPSWSPRSKVTSTYNNTDKLGEPNWGKNSTYWNKAVRNTVKYDNLGNISANVTQPLTVGDMRYYEDKFTNWPSNNSQKMYLYDVWIGDTTSGDVADCAGYGISFWSTDNHNNLNITGYATMEALLSVAPEAEMNTFGYWGMNYGWKHYYGLYEVPKGQTRTEFAYQSRTALATEGNYLDGISFLSPAFLSLDQSIKNHDKEEAKYVTLNDILTVELYSTGYGEIKADNIEIVNKFAPYDEYIDFNGNVTVTKNGSPISGFTITEPRDDNDQTLKITLPPSITMSDKDNLKVTFEIKVRTEVKSTPSMETLLFYFKNQGEITYHEDKQSNSNGFTGYIDKVKTNASEIAQIYIDPIKLIKTVTPVKDGKPFTITLKVMDTTDGTRTISTKGLITDLIPAGFTVTNLPEGAILTTNTDGSTRITIQNVNLGNGVAERTYSYNIEYTGTKYGVTYTSTYADYKYKYLDLNYELSVMLDFIKEVVGVTIKTQDDSFIIDGGTTTRLLNIVENDNFKEAMADGNYDVTPEVVLLRNDEDVEAKVNSDGNYQIDAPQYTAVLIRGSNRLEFTPKIGANGSYELYYKINLTATKAGSPSFELSSRETTVTVDAVGNEVVYYEKYIDNTFGFYSSSGTVLQELDNDKIILENGYGVLSATTGNSVQLAGGALSTTYESTNNMYLYRIPTTAIEGVNLQTVKFGIANSMVDIGKIHPNFAKTVYTTVSTSLGENVYIRTPEQMKNMSLVDTTGKIFMQERNLDFDNILLDREGAIVAGLFKGRYEGNNLNISNVVINATGSDNVGLFSQNEGNIAGINLKATTSIIGNNNVGGIVGHNRSGGVIKDCIVEGIEDVNSSGSYIGMHIEGHTNVGGIVGLNEGNIESCIVRNTNKTVKGIDYVGAVAGVNGTTATIHTSKVEKVRLELEGTNVGVVGANLNVNENVDITATDLICDAVNLSTENVNIEMYSIGGEENVDTEVVNGEEVNEEEVNEEVINEAVNEETVNEEAVNEETVNEETVNEEVINEEVINEEVINEETEYTFIMKDEDIKNTGEPLFPKATEEIMINDLPIYGGSNQNGEGEDSSDEKDKENKILDDKSGASLVFVLAIMLLLMAIGTSVLISASTNTGTIIRQKEHNQAIILDDAVHKNIMYSLQSNTGDKNLLSAQLITDICNTADVDNFLEELDFFPDTGLSISFDDESLEAETSNIKLESIVVSFPKKLTEMVKITDAVPAIYSYDSSGNQVLDRPREPRVATVNATMTVTVEISVDGKINVSRAFYEYTGGFLSDDPTGMYANDNSDIKHDMVLVPDAEGKCGEWRLIKHEKVDR